MSESFPQRTELCSMNEASPQALRMKGKDAFGQRILVQLHRPALPSTFPAQAKPAGSSFRPRLPLPWPDPTAPSPLAKTRFILSLFPGTFCSQN